MKSDQDSYSEREQESEFQYNIGRILLLTNFKKSQSWKVTLFNIRNIRINKISFKAPYGLIEICKTYIKKCAISIYHLEPVSCLNQKDF